MITNKTKCANDLLLKNMDKNKLLEILLGERDYHALHPAQAGATFYYSFGATLTTIVAGLIFKEQIAILDRLVSDTFFSISMAIIFVGYSFIFFSIAEHSKIHKMQLDRIENAIEYLLNPKIIFDYTKFWEIYGKTHFSINNAADNYVKLLTKEPDTRKGFRFHDRKLETGIFTISIGIIILVIVIIKLSK